MKRLKRVFERLTMKIFNIFYGRMHRRLMKESPFFLFGSFRGGTTLLQRILNSLPNVYIWGEQGFFIKSIADSYYITLDKKKFNDKLSQVENPFFLSTENLKTPTKWVAWENWYGKLRYQDNFRRLVKSFFCPKHKNCHWGFKEIRYGSNDRVIPFLNDIYPQAKFVFIVRHPVEIIISQTIFRMPFKDEEKRELYIRRRINKWNLQNQAYLNFIKENPSNGFMISYEEIVKDGKNALNRLVDFLGFKLTEKQTRILNLKQGRRMTLTKKKKDALNENEISFIQEETREVWESVKKYLSQF